MLAAWRCSFELSLPACPACRLPSVIITLFLLSLFSLSLPPLLLYIASPSRRAVAFPPFVYLYARSSTLFPSLLPFAAAAAAACAPRSAGCTREITAPLPQGLLRAEPLPLSVGGVGKGVNAQKKKNQKKKRLLELSLPAPLVSAWLGRAAAAAVVRGVCFAELHAACRLLLLLCVSAVCPARLSAPPAAAELPYGRRGGGIGRQAPKEQEGGTDRRRTACADPTLPHCLPLSLPFCCGILTVPLPTGHCTLSVPLRRVCVKTTNGMQHHSDARRREGTMHGHSAEQLSARVLNGGF
jgi:hypothetical protein